MDLTYDFTVPAGLDETWAAFNHLELIASCFPGVTLTSVSGQDFAGELKVKLGPSTLAFVGAGRFVERHLGGRHTVILADGVDRRGKGTVSAKITASLSAAGNTTAVHLSTRLSFAGQPAQLAPEVLQEAGDRLVAQFADAVAAKFATGLGAQALDADANPTFASALGKAASSSSKTYLWSPPSPAGQTDYEKFVQAAPIVASRLGPPLLGGLALLWLVRRIRRR